MDASGVDWPTFLTTTQGVALIGSGCLLVGAILGAVINSLATRRTSKDRIAADIKIAERKLEADLAINDRKLKSETVQRERERRIALYYAVQDSLPGLTQGGNNRAQINEFLNHARRIWLVAPPSVVRAIEDLVNNIVSGNAPLLETKLGEMVLAFRQDLLSEGEAEGPPNQGLTEADFRVRSAA